MPDFESQVREIIYTGELEIDTHKKRESLEEAILAAHTSSLAYVIGEDEKQPTPPAGMGMASDIFLNTRNRLRAEQRKRAGL